ncbi:MAG: hypothetical protein CL846_10130 [Crocinitomicaceae bacterium]|nr:hypothetical protein [Crocinitomicaceae bacterium]|tara:strand:- start:2658 stop:5297 length:2640 start_codon:yes stop_codon:yes gene_type:complete
MKRHLRNIFILFGCLNINLSWGISNQELSLIYNSILGDKNLALNAELSSAYLKKDIEKSLYYAQENLTKSLQSNDIAKISFAHQIIGKVYLEMGELTRALEQFKIAEEKFVSIKKWKEIALNHILIGNVYYSSGDAITAKHQFDNCKKIGEKIVDNCLIASAFIASFDIKKNKANENNLEILDKAIFYTNIINIPNVKAGFFTIIGHRYQNLEKYDLAINFYQKSIQLYRQTNNVQALVETLYESGKIKERLMLFNDAKNFYEEGLKNAKENSYLAGIKVGCLKLSSFYENQGNYKKSALYLKQLNTIKILQEEEELKVAIELADQEKELILEKEKTKSDLKLKEQQIVLDKKDLNFKNTFLLLLGGVIIILFLFIGLLFYAFRTKSLVVKKLEESNEKILLIQKEKDDFLAYTSHEIRTPLSAVVGSAELLENSPLNKPQQKHLSSIKTSANNILFLVNDILDLAKLEKRKITLEKIPFSIKRLIDDLFIALNSKAIHNNVKLIKEIDDYTPEEINGDPVRIHQVLVNLLDNAIKFTKGGEVLLNAKLRKSKSENFIDFKVKDNGSGINNDKLKTIFNPYTQENKSTTRQYGGTGLGLSICKNIIDIMGGEISVESSVGKGSVFSFSIPINNLDSNDQKLNENINLSLEKIKILLVEDDLLNGELYSSLLKNKEKNIFVDWVKNGQEALDLLANDKAYEIIIMDLEMPVKNGIETAKEIRNKLNLVKTPILGMTAHVVNDVLDKCLIAGMNDCISKPFQAKQIKNKIKELLIKSDKKLNIAFDNLTQNDPKKKEKYITIFEESTKKDLSIFKKALKSKDKTLIKNQLHKMKGASLTMGLSKLSDHILKMEQKKSLDLNEELIILETLFVNEINLLKTF